MESSKPTYKELEDRIKKLETELNELKKSYRTDIDKHKKIEKLLRESEDRLSKIMLAANDGTWDWNLKTNNVYFDPRYYKMAGYNIDEFPHRLEEFQKRVHPDDIKMVMGKVQKYLKGELNNYKIEFRYKKKNEDWIWIMGQGVIVEKDKDGTPLRFVGTHTDITKRKSTEKELQKSEKNYRMLIKSASDAFFQGDEHGNIILTNNKACELTGYSKKELMGINMLDLFSKNTLKQKPLQYNLLKAGKTIKTEREIIRKGGISLSVEMHSKMMSDNTFQSFFRDITERKKIEEELKQSESYNRVLFHESNIPLIVMDAKTYKYLDCNKAAIKIYGYKNKKEIIGKTPLDVSPEIQFNGEKSSVVAQCMIKEALEKGSVIFEWKHQKTNGDIWDGEVHLMSIKHNRKKLLQFSLLDITERRKTREQLKENEENLKKLNATKDKFFSIIAHDLINPIGNIMNFSNLLTENFGNFNNEQNKEFIKDISEASKSTFNLLQNLLEWSRTQTNRIEFLPEIFNIEKIVNKNIVLLKSIANTKDISIISKVNSKHKVFADKNMVTTIIRNLISNAIKFTVKGNITIYSEKDGNHIKTSIVDTGIGIKKENISKLFSLNKNISGTGTSGEKGTGLGLILCKEFVERNNGEIWIESEVGKGSKFIFTLPAKQ